tara:strand:- start:740 stop:922 length:183 start_codon:yes stop_codon:yes gene_type:complete
MLSANNRSRNLLHATLAVRQKTLLPDLQPVHSDDRFPAAAMPQTLEYDLAQRVARTFNVA